MNSHSHRGSLIENPRMVFRTLSIDGEESYQALPLGSRDAWPSADHLDFTMVRAYGSGWERDLASRDVTLTVEMVSLNLTLRYRWFSVTRVPAALLQGGRPTPHWLIGGPHIGGSHNGCAHVQNDCVVTALEHKVGCALCLAALKWARVVQTWRQAVPAESRTRASWESWRAHFRARSAPVADLWPLPPELRDGTPGSLDWMEAP